MAVLIVRSPMGIAFLSVVLFAAPRAIAREVSFGVAAAAEVGPAAQRIGPRIAIYGLVPSAELTPSLQLDVGVRASGAYHELRVSHGFTGASYVFEALPVARVGYALSALVHPYLEYGIGLAWMRFTSDDGHSPAEGGQIPVLHAGAGVTLAASETIRWVVEVRAHVYPKRGSNIFVAAPSCGVEFP